MKLRRGTCPRCAQYRRISRLKRLDEASTYRAIVHALPDVLMRFDRQGRHLFVSDNVTRVTTLRPEQFIGKTHQELGFPIALCELWEEAIEEAWRTAQPVEREFDFLSKSGPVTFNWRLVPELNLQGAVTSVLSISRDVTAQRRAEADYQALFQEMLDGVARHEIICNAQGIPVDYRFLSVNPAFERLTGLKAQAIVGRTVREAIPGIEDHWIDAYGKVALTGEPAFFESYVADLDKHFQVTAFRPVPGQFVCIFVDITERMRAATALRESQERLQAIVDNASLLVYVKDLEGRFTLLNRKCELLLGAPRAQLLGKTSHDLLPSHLADSHWANDILAVQKGTSITLEEVNEESDGTHTYITTKFPLFDSSGAITGVCGISADVSALKRAEAEKAHLALQLQQAQKMESVGRLAGGVAHDFNNMLGVILSNVELALEQVVASDPVRADLEEIRTATERSSELTAQLLAFARQQPIVPRVLDLNDTVASMLRMLRRLIGEDIELEWCPSETLWPVKMDPIQTNQILANLCVNARDAIKDNGKVCIATRNCTIDPGDRARYAERGIAPGDYVMVSVRDDGCGMDRDTLAHLFEPFFTTKRVGEGTGLGLAMVYGAVGQNGGFIDVASDPGQGTTFEIYLPRAGSGRDEVLDNSSDAKPLDSPADTLDPITSPHKTILLVEDESAMLSAVKRMLTVMGYEVLTASTASEARQVAAERAGSIDLLISDVVMPGINGRELSVQLLSLSPGMRVLFMSGYTPDVTARYGLSEIGADFIQKPFTARELAQRVRGLLSRPSAA